MINRPPSNLQPLNSEDTRLVVQHVWKALTALPNHRHNSRGNPADCGECIAKVNLIKAYQIMFKRFGEK